MPNPESRPVPPPHPRRSVRAIVLAIVKVVVSVGLLVLLIRRIDTAQMLRVFVDLRWDWLLAGIGLLQLQGVISTLKWQAILTADSQRVRFFFLFKTYKIANFLSLFLPTSFGGDVYRAWALNRIGVKMSKSTASVLFDRLSGLFALLSIGVVGCVVLLDARSALILVAVYLTVCAGFLIATEDFVVARLPETTAKYLGFPFRLIRSFNTYRHHEKTFAWSLLLSAAFQFNSVLIVGCYARSLHIRPAEVSFLEMVAVVPIVFLSEVLPSINGIGVRESAFVFLFSRVGSTPEHAMAVSLMVLVTRYLQSLGGAALWMWDLFGKRRKEPHPDIAHVPAESAHVPGA